MRKEYRDYNPQGEPPDEVDMAFVEKEISKAVQFIRQIIFKEEVTPLELHDALERADLLLRDVIGSRKAEDVYDELEELLEKPMPTEAAPYEYTKSVLAQALSAFSELDAQQKRTVYAALLSEYERAQKERDAGFAA